MVVCFNKRMTHYSFILHLKDPNTPEMVQDLERVAWLTMNNTNATYYNHQNKQNHSMCFVFFKKPRWWLFAKMPSNVEVHPSWVLKGPLILLLLKMKISQFLVIIYRLSLIKLIPMIKARDPSCCVVRFFCDAGCHIGGSQLASALVPVLFLSAHLLALRGNGQLVLSVEGHTQ